MTAFEMGFMDKMAEAEDGGILPVIGGLTGAGVGAEYGAREISKLMKWLSNPPPGSEFVQKGPGYAWKALPPAGASRWRMPSIRNPSLAKFKIPAAILGALAFGNFGGRIGYHGVKGIQNSDKQAEAEGGDRTLPLLAGAVGGIAGHALIPGELKRMAGMAGEASPRIKKILDMIRGLKGFPSAAKAVSALAPIAGAGAGYMGVKGIQNSDKQASGTSDPDTLAMKDRAPDPGFHKALLKKTPKPAAASPKPVRRPGSGSLLLTR